MQEKTIEAPQHDVTRIISNLTDASRISMKNSTEVNGYHQKENSIAVISDCTAVSGFKDIGAIEGLSVIESKASLITKFTGVNAVPICLEMKDIEEVISAVNVIAQEFDAICLEGISVPRCMEIEKELKGKLNIPIFHDNKYGTAIVVSTGLVNVSRLLHKELSDLLVVVDDARSDIIEMFYTIGVKQICTVNIVDNGDYNKEKEANNENATSMEAAKADVIVEVKDNIVKLEITMPFPETANEVGKKINVLINPDLAFYGIVKGTLKCGVTEITESIELAAIYALASIVSERELSEGCLLPNADEKTIDIVARNVESVARDLELTRK